MEQESKIPFIINFVKEENKIEKIFTKESNESFIVSYKDIDSGACMHCDFVNPPYHVGNTTSKYIFAVKKLDLEGNQQS